MWGNVSWFTSRSETPRMYCRLQGHRDRRIRWSGTSWIRGCSREGSGNSCWGGTGRVWVSLSPKNVKKREKNVCLQNLPSMTPSTSSRYCRVIDPLLLPLLPLTDHLPNLKKYQMTHSLPLTGYLPNQKKYHKQNVT